MVGSPSHSGAHQRHHHLRHRPLAGSRRLWGRGQRRGGKHLEGVRVLGVGGGGARVRGVARRGDPLGQVPEFYEPLMLSRKRTRQALKKKQIKSKINTKSLNMHRRSFEGVLPRVWQKMPEEIIEKGYNRGWLKIIKDCKKYILTNSSGVRSGKKLKIE